jgi:hypothetical protein
MAAFSRVHDIKLNMELTDQDSSFRQGEGMGLAGWLRNSFPNTGARVQAPCGV